MCAQSHKLARTLRNAKSVLSRSKVIKEQLFFSMKENLREDHKFVRLLCQRDGSLVAVIQSKYCLAHIHTGCGVLLALGTSNLIIKHQ